MEGWRVQVLGFRFWVQVLGKGEAGQGTGWRAGVQVLGGGEAVRVQGVGLGFMDTEEREGQVGQRVGWMRDRFTKFTSLLMGP